MSICKMQESEREGDAGRGCQVGKKEGRREKRARQGKKSQKDECRVKKK